MRIEFMTGVGEGGGCQVYLWEVESVQGQEVSKPRTVKAVCVHLGSILFLFKQLFCGLSESVKQVGF